MEAEKVHIRHCLLYEFDLGHSAAEAHRNISRMYGENVLTERACQQWFQRFRNGERQLEDQPRSGRPKEMTDGDLLEAIQGDDKVTVAELSEKFQVHRTTIERRIHVLGYVVKLDAWVPHELSQRNKEDRMACCVSHLARQNDEGFLRRMVTGDEKWVLYKNVKRRRTVCKKGEPPASTSKGGLHPRKVLLSVWWDSRGVIYWELLEPNQTLTADLYCQQLERLQQAMRDKRPALVNRHGVIFHHDNARPHTAAVTQRKLTEIGWQLLPHPPYSPDLAPTDYHLFRSLDNYLQGREYNTEEDLRTGLANFFEGKGEDFYRRGIQQLTERWRQVIDNNGDYIID